MLRWIPALLLLSLAACGDPSSPGAPTGFPDAPAPPRDGSPGLQLGPIPGVTSGWHALADGGMVEIPAEAEITLRCVVAPGDRVAWEGAVERSRSKQWSTARLAPVDPDLRVRVTVLDPSGRLRSHQARLRRGHSLLRVDAVALEPVSLPAEEWPPVIGVEQFFGESAGQIRRLGPDHWLVPRDTPLRLVARGVPASALVEWRQQGRPMHLGPAWRHRFVTVGTHHIEAGAPGTARSVRVDVYDVEITSHVSDVDRIPHNRPVTFTARTDPPGWERHVTWFASTSYGTVEPAWSTGRTFTPTFRDTWGGGPTVRTQWLGVRADAALFNQDQKSTGAIFWTDRGTDAIYAAGADGSNRQAVVEGGVEDPSGVDFDPSTGRLYWAECLTEDSRIATATLFSGGLTLLSTPCPTSVDLDLTAGKIYWSELTPNSIRRADLDGSNPELVVTAPGSPWDLEVDETTGKVYWVGLNGDAVYRADFGQAPEVLFQHNLPGEGPRGIALDPAGDRMFWSAGSEIWTAALDGSGAGPILEHGIKVNRIALDPATQTLYFLQGGGGIDGVPTPIYRCDTDGSNVQVVDLLTTGANGIARGFPEAAGPQ